MFIRVLTYDPVNKNKGAVSLVNTKKISYIDEDLIENSSITDLTLRTVIYFGNDGHCLRSTESIFDLETKLAQAKKENYLLLD